MKRDSNLEILKLRSYDSLAPEERHQLYKMVRLEVVVRLDANLEVKGVFGEGLLVSNLELVPGFQEDLARHRV
jgi:hypothetical protein